MPRRFTTSKRLNRSPSIITQSHLPNDSRHSSPPLPSPSQTLHLLISPNLQMTKRRNPLSLPRVFQTQTPPLPSANPPYCTVHGSRPRPMDKTHRLPEAPWPNSQVINRPETTEVTLLSSYPKIIPATHHLRFPCPFLPTPVPSLNPQNTSMLLQTVPRVQSTQSLKSPGKRCAWNVP
jgi:hypothetical protein